MKITSTVLENGIINIHIPVTVKRRGGRKVIISPDSALPVFTTQQDRHDHAMIKALVKAYKWRKMYESGSYPSREALARKLEISDVYLDRILRLNMLAPDIKEAILDGRQPRTLTLGDLCKSFPVIWEEQRRLFGFPIS